MSVLLQAHNYHLRGLMPIERGCIPRMNDKSFTLGFLFQVEFGPIKFSHPKVHEADGTGGKLLPYMARLRKTTYLCAIYVNVQ